LKRELLSLIFRDAAREEALQSLLSSVITSFREEKKLDKKINSYLRLVPLLGEVFKRKVKVKVAGREYPLALKRSTKQELLSSFNAVKGSWIVAVDETQSSAELFLGHSSFFTGSLAFGMKVSPLCNEGRERLLGVVSSFKVFEDERLTKNKLELQTYIQNLLVALYASLILASQGQRLYALFLDGPLIRALHHLLFVTFSVQELQPLFTLDPGLSAPWANKTFPSQFLGSPLTASKLADGSLLAELLNHPAYDALLNRIELRPELLTRFEATFNQLKSKKVVPGLFLYFALLRLLIDFTARRGTLLIGAVKLSHVTKEFIRFYYSRAFAKLADRNKNFRLRLYETALFAPEERFSEKLKKGELEKILIEEMSLADDQLLTFCLDYSPREAYFTEPFEIRRYRSKSVNFEEVFLAEESYPIGSPPYGSASGELQDYWLERSLLKNFLPQSYYRFYMSFIRTSDLKFPLRIEFPQKSLPRLREIANLTYTLSSVYRNYGIPIVLKYADELVRVPTSLISRLSKGLIREKLLKELLAAGGGFDSYGELIKGLICNFKRDFYSR